MAILTNETRRKIRNIVRDLHAKKTRSEIAVELNAQGFRRPDGRPCDANFVTSQCHSIGLRKFRRKTHPAKKSTTAVATATTPKHDKEMSAWVDLVVSSKLNRDQKLKMIEALL